MRILYIYRHPDMGYSIGKVFRPIEEEMFARKTPLDKAPLLYKKNIKIRFIFCFVPTYSYLCNE